MTRTLAALLCLFTFLTVTMTTPQAIAQDGESPASSEEVEEAALPLIPIFAVLALVSGGVFFMIIASGSSPRNDEAARSQPAQHSDTTATPRATEQPDGSGSDPDRVPPTTPET